MRPIPEWGIATFASLLDMPRGDEALVDIGACHNPVGAATSGRLREALRKVGMRVVRASMEPKPMHGVEGRATPVEVSLVPISMAGEAGVIEVTVIKEEVPFLLSVGFLDSLGACIDLRNDTMDVSRFGCEVNLRRLPTGHRAVQVGSWPVGQDTACRRFGPGPSILARRRR